MKWGGLKVRAYHTTNQHLPNRAIQASIQKPRKIYFFNPWDFPVGFRNSGSKGIYKYNKDVRL